jgi:hypothetical protein
VEAEEAEAEEQEMMRSRGLGEINVSPHITGD